MKKILHYSLEDKAEVINGGLYDIYREARKLDYFGDGSLIAEIHSLCEKNFSYYYDYKVCKAIHNSVKRKRKLVSKKVNNLNFSANGKVAFVTLTFNDETLNKTSQVTRRRKVSYTLKACSKIYVANIDFGKKHDREHYHALLGFDDYQDIKDLENKIRDLWGGYGFIKVERVGNDESDKLRTRNYLVKLAFHAIKDSTKNHRLIYSRNVVQD